MGKKLSTAIKVATITVPAALSIIQKYGPGIRKVMHDNPELVETVKDRFQKVVKPSRAGGGVTSLDARIDTLKDQVASLYASANTPAVAEQAKQWRRELDSLSQAAPILNAMGKKARRLETRRIEQRIDELSRKILAARVGDDIEDAIIVDE
ncbi:MAG: hypothetical protein PUK40_00670 [Actinomycetaceae bacterium]|nr:hypothetical protein [Arcanobacterium sp.]MDD7504454.1 hypothetical protein [Actinomycetaceae bacterium]MDY6143989.1 hypothetical protein [Arcanobacterium sp.]